MADVQVAVELIGKDNLSGTLQNASKGFGGLVDGLGRIGLAGQGLQTIFGTIQGGVSALVGPAMEAEQNAAKLNAVLASTKGVAGMTAESIGALSTSLSRVTMFEDDAITSAQSLLLTFTNVGSDVFPAATETILNMSTALGQDLSNSAMQVGKALNDPIAGVGALRRVGVQLSDAQEELIKQMVATGDVAGAQAVILGELETQFGGAARAAGDTLAGSLAIAQNQLGEVQEEIGTALLPVLAKLLEALLPVIQSFADALPGALETVQPLLEWLGEHTEAIIVPALVLLGTIAVATGASIVAAMSPIVIPIAAIGLAVSALAVLWTSNWGDIQGKTEAVWSVIQPIFQALGAAIDLFVTYFLPAMLASWTTTWNTIATVFTTVWGVIQTTITTVWPIVEKIIEAGIALVQGDWEKAWTAVQKAFELTWNAVKGLVETLVQTVLNLLSQLATDAGNAARNVGEAIVNGVKGAISSLGDGIKDALMSAINGALDAAKRALESWKPSLPNIPVPGFGGGGPAIAGGDFGPSASSQGAINWAMNRIGQSGWAGWCEKFVENAFGTSGRYASAWAAAQAMMTNPGGSMAGAPAGTIMYFRPHASNGGYGHVGISLGNGQMISATNNGPEVTGVNNYWQSLYAGYGPPKFAGGTRNFGGGLAIVGERGWELASLPRGTDVYSHGQSQRILADAGGITFQFLGPVYGFDDFEDKIVQANERAARRGRQ